MSGPECEKCGEHCLDCTCEKKMGRPPKSINWERVNEMLEAGSDGEEIAADLGVHADTLYAHVKEKYGQTFTAYSASRHSVGMGKIRLEQYKKALRGNVQLLLFLGRVRLKQVEAQPEKVEALPPHEDYLLLKDENIRLKYELRKASASSES